MAVERLLPLCVWILVGLSGEAIGGTDTCYDLGFSSNLLCSSCDDLKQFSLEKLQDSCRSCCQKEDEKISIAKVLLYWPICYAL
jgi:hypothetical protein